MRKFDLPEVLLLTVIGGAGGIAIFVLVFELNLFMALRYFIGIIGLSTMATAFGFLLHQAGIRDMERDDQKLALQQRRLEVIRGARELEEKHRADESMTRLTRRSEGGGRRIISSGLEKETEDSLVRAESVFAQEPPSSDS